MNAEWGYFWGLFAGSGVLTAVFCILCLGRQKSQSRLTEKLIDLLVLLAPFCIGLYHVWLSALAAVILLGALLWQYHCQGELVIRKNIALLAVTVFLLMFPVSGLWAVDRGEALFGFVKFLPMWLFLIMLMQLSGERRERLWTAAAMGSVGMVMVSGILRFVPGLDSFFLVNGRLAGFFQYPNTFAIYLLCGLLWLTGEEMPWRKKLPCMAVLFAGIVFSGSRTTAALLAVALAVLFFRKGDRRWKRAVLLTAIGCGLVCVIIAAAFGNPELFRRYLVFPARSSTFLGRLLYAKDALPVILKNPLGLGYGGYAYAQGSFQTGVYEVRHIHNELLQMLLDTGWLPAVLMAAAVILAFRRQDFRGRLLLGVLTAHSLFDFDFQFAIMDFLLVLLLDLDSGRQVRIGGKRAQRLAVAVTSVLISLCICIGSVDFLFWRGRTEWALVLDPAHTRSLMVELTKADTAQEMGALADKILQGNQMVSLAWDAKAEAAFFDGDGETMITCKRRAIALDPYGKDGYEDYFNKLLIYTRVYLDAGLDASAEFCREQILEIPPMLEQVKADTSVLGWKIYDKPELDLSKTCRIWLELLGSEDWKRRLGTAMIPGLP